MLNNNIAKLKLFKECSHLKLLGIYNENNKKCPKATKQYLFQNCLKHSLLDYDMIYLKHQKVCCNMVKCQYPAHKSMKAKNCANNQYISPTVAYEINQWFSSAATSFNIFMDSKCCNICQLCVYLDLKSKPQFI